MHEKRKLGKDGPLVSPLGLGCMNMSEFYGPTDRKRALATLDRALEIGINFWDTADIYGNGENERLLSVALENRRDEVILATKFGFIRNSRGEFVGLSGRPEFVKQACDASLRRLKVEIIDLYYQHRVDPAVPIEETVGALADLVSAGKVRFVGLSEAGSETLRRAQAVHPITALQTEYSLWSREVETDILTTCRELGIGFVAYSPLGRGFLSGKIEGPNDLAEDDFRRITPRFEAKNLARNLALLETVKQVAAGKGCTPAQVALAWLLLQGRDIVPIPGTSRPERLAENAASWTVSLSPQEIQQIELALAPSEIRGARYPEEHLALTNA